MTLFGWFCACVEHAELGRVPECPVDPADGEVGVDGERLSAFVHMAEVAEECEVVAGALERFGGDVFVHAGTVARPVSAVPARRTT